MSLNITYTQEEQLSFSKPPLEIKTNKLSDMVSKECYRRIYELEVTNLEFITIMGCISDNVKFLGTKFHKEEIGLITVVIDIISIIFIYYMFGKLNQINDEYLEILDNNVIRMKDFTIQIRMLQIDNSSQDVRILKLKIWLHFNELLKKFRTETNQMEVADVQFSLSKQEKHVAIFKMQEFERRVRDIKNRMNAGEYSALELYNRTNELQSIEERQHRLREKYKAAVAQEEKNALAVSIAPKWQLLDMVEYVYITFKSNQTPKKNFELFVAEPTFSKIIRRIFCIDDEIKDNVEYDDQQLVI